MRTPDERVAWAATQVGTTSWTGMCEAFTRSCFPFDAMYGSAHDAWKASAAAGPVHLDWDAPVGVPVFFDITYGDNAAYDHIALSSGGGRCYSTSAGPGSTLVEVGIQELNTRWGMTYRGWGEIYHGVRVYEGKDTDMALSDDDVDRIAAAVWKYVLIESGEIPEESASSRLVHIRKAVLDDQQRENVAQARVNGGQGHDDVWLSTATGWTLDSLAALKADMGRLVADLPPADEPAPE